MSVAQTVLKQALTPGSLICLDTNCLLYYFKDKMPWAENLRPVFVAKDGGTVKLITSSLTLTELLADAVSPDEETRLLSAVRQYFDFIPVDDNIGIDAAGIRRTSIPEGKSKPSVETPDAIEMATANQTQSLIFITNDEQLTRFDEQTRILYLKDLALDWMKDEFAACLATNVTVALSTGVSTFSLNLRIDGNEILMQLDAPLSHEAFVEVALKLGELVEGPSAVIGIAEGEAGSETVRALRLLSVSRPWIKPTLPDWFGQITGKKHVWDEPGPWSFITAIRKRIEETNKPIKKTNEQSDVTNASTSPQQRAVSFVVVNVSRLAAENEIYIPSNQSMPEHKKRQEVWRRYLAPFLPMLPLLELDGARLWRGEAKNGHELDLTRFLRFFACARNVIGKEGGR